MPSNNNNNSSNSNNLVVTLNNNNNNTLDICSTPGNRKCPADTTNTTTDLARVLLASTPLGTGPMGREDLEDQVDLLAILLVLHVSLATR